MKLNRIFHAVFTSLFLFSTSLFAKDSFPEYSKSLYLADCSASCMFSSCSGEAKCKCSCSWFTCTCTWDFEQTTQVLPISMTEEQYNNTKQLATVLKSMDDIVAQSAYQNIVSMINNLKDKDYNLFVQNRDRMVKSVNKLSSSNKQILNNFFKELGTEERV